MIFYEIKISYDRQLGEANPGHVKETYLVEGLTCSDVEERLLKAVNPFGEWEINSCRKVQFYDLLPSPEGDVWYKVRVEMITIEDDGKETRKGVNVYVEAADTTQADKTVRQALSNLDCEVVSIARTAIMDVLRAVN